MRSREEILETLCRDLEKARKKYESSRLELKEVMDDIPSGLPQPDSNSRIIQSGCEHRTALADFATAVREYNGFLLRGEIPERLREDGARS